MKKTIALVLCVLMMLSLLAGCGSKAESPEPKPETTSTEPATEPAKSAEPAKLRLIMYGDNSERRDEYFKKDFHDRILEELNIDFSVDWLPWSDYSAGGTTITNMLASGEGFAFENITSLFDWHTKGYVAEITEEQIQENMPDYLRVRGESNGFDCCKYQGKIYCVPIGAKSYSGTHQYIGIRNELLNEVGKDYTEIKTYDDFVDAITAVKEAHPEMCVMYGKSDLRWMLADTYVPGWNFTEMTNDFVVVNEAEDNDTVYSYYETDLYKQYVYLMQDWVKRGWQTESYITNPGQDTADWNAGNAICVFAGPDNLLDSGLSFDTDLRIVKIGGERPNIKIRDYDWGISISAGDAEKVSDWLRLINWIYASQENYNFCCFGVEGKDWERAEDGSVKRLISESLWDEWFLKAMCYTVLDSSIPQEKVDAYMNFDNGSIISKTSGFTFDTTNVETETALLSAVKSEYLDAMSAGFLDYDTNFETVLAKLKEAGLDKYVEEYQRQYSEWRASK